MTSKNILVLDLETQKSFKEVGRHNLHKLKISVVGVYDYQTGEYMCYGENEIMDLEKRLQSVDLLIGFNIRGFDLPVLAPYLFMSIEQIPVLDLLDAVLEARGHRASLDSIAGPTLKKHKSGSGSNALILYKEGRWEELKKYCLDDVMITKEVYEYGCLEGKISFTSSWDFKTYDIPVHWQEETERVIAQAEQSQSFPSSLF